MNMTHLAIDGFDRALLAQLQTNNLTPARILADRVGLSTSAVLRRLRRMRKEGIIQADISIISPAVLGETVSILVLVSLVQENTAALDKFCDKMKSYAAVKKCSYVAGETDFVIRLQMVNIESYEVFIRSAFLDDPNVAKFTTLVVLRDIL
jgi:Lrp/AsnC family transcriptional regulator, leucine-responsive regulatory protein